MRKCLYLAVLAALAASCSNDGVVEQLPQSPTTPNNQNVSTSDVPLGFVVSSKNMTKATMLQNVGIYNFGVFAYKNTEPTYNVMDNYLVGYMDDTNKLGYYMTVENQTTLGDPAGAANGASMWAYEKMGNTEYDYTGPEGYYQKTNLRYMSNNDKQYLRYWDKESDYTMFYAYTPYVNKQFTATEAGGGAALEVTYDNSTRTMIIPGGAIHDGYNNPTDNEFMIASAKVAKADYGQDVPLKFRHLIAKFNIKFWEDIDGYDVRIINLSNDYGGVYGVPAIKSSTDQYKLGTYYKTSGVSVVFDEDGNGTVSQVNAVAHDLTKTSEALQFAVPIENAIGTTQTTACASPTTYYAIPKPAETGGLTFHVSYELKSTTGERITVNDATVHVPAEMCAWQANKHYTYVFKITKNTNGTTDTPDSIDPLDPNVSGVAALMPIIFDNCTIEDWESVDGGQYDISDANTKYYSISLDRGSVKKNSATDNVITATLYERGVAVSSADGTWSVKKPGVDTPVTLTTSDPKTVAVTVGADWTAGEYILTFTPAASMSVSDGITIQTKFYVVDDYKVTLNATEVGTKGKAKSVLTITTDGYALSAGCLSIEYPAAVTLVEDKNKVRIENDKVVVMKDAVPGDYKIVYTVDNSVKSAFAFKVVDYALNTGIDGNSVGLSQVDQIFDVTTAASTADLAFSITAPEGATADMVTFDNDTKKITVKPGATVGQYKLTLVVDNGGTKTTYERVFEVKNVYSLKIYSDVSAGTECYLVDNDTPVDDSTPVQLTVVATKNGAKDTTTELGFTAMTGVSLGTGANNRTITINRNATPNNYIVSWIVDGKTVAAATLVVTD